MATTHPDNHHPCDDDKQPSTGISVPVTASIGASQFTVNNSAQSTPSSISVNADVTRVFQISLAEKPSQHWSMTNSANIPQGGESINYPIAYTIDGVFVNQLYLLRNHIYEFQVRTDLPPSFMQSLGGRGTETYPFFFSTNQRGADGGASTIPTLQSQGIVPTSKANIRLKVGKSLPARFWYQCSTESYMGGEIVIVDFE